jgi:hypothetical protein
MTIPTTISEGATGPAVTWELTNLCGVPGSGGG